MLLKLKNFLNDLLQIYFNKKLIPNALYIEPTNLCNANCIFCAYKYDNRKKEYLKDEYFKKALIEAKKIGVTKINFTPVTGEVLLDKDFFNKVNFAKELGFKDIITYTNLINANKNDLKMLLQSGLTELHISTAPLIKDVWSKIYQNKNYNRLLNNLEEILVIFNSLKQKRVKKIYIEFRADRSYKECINTKDFIKHIKPHLNEDIILGAFNSYDNWTGIIKEEELLDGMNIAPNRFKFFPCARLSNIQISSNGDIRVCGCRFDPTKDDIFKVGNIQKESIFDSYNSYKVKELKNSFITFSLPKECKECRWY